MTWIAVLLAFWLVLALINLNRARMEVRALERKLEATKSELTFVRETRILAASKPPVYNAHVEIPRRKDHWSDPLG